MILHLTDLHIPADDKNKIEEIRNIFNNQVYKHIDNKMIVCITGDTFDSADTSIGSLGFELANEIIYNTQKIAKDVIIIRGTTTHDAPNSLNHLKYFNNNVHVIEKPEVIKIDNYVFFAMPGAYASSFDKQWGVNINMQELIIKQLRDWGKKYGKIDNRNKIFLGHMMLSEVQENLKFLQEFQDIHYEPPINLDIILTELNPSLILLGHIHKDYKFEKTFYGGALLQNNFNEANVYEIEPKSGKFELVVNNNRYFSIYDLSRNSRKCIQIEQSYEKVILICSDKHDYKKSVIEFLDGKQDKIIDLMIKTDSKKIKDEMQEIIQSYNNIRESKIKIVITNQLSDKERIKKEISNKIISTIDPYERFEIYVKSKYGEEKLDYEFLMQEHKSFYDNSLNH